MSTRHGSSPNPLPRTGVLAFWPISIYPLGKTCHHISHRRFGSTNSPLGAVGISRREGKAGLGVFCSWSSGPHHVDFNGFKRSSRIAVHLASLVCLRYSCSVQASEAANGPWCTSVLGISMSDKSPRSGSQSHTSSEVQYRRCSVTDWAA